MSNRPQGGLFGLQNPPETGRSPVGSIATPSANLQTARSGNRG